MRTFTRDYRIPHIEAIDYNRYFGGLKPCVFDIETTGLSRANSKVILCAMLSPVQGGVRVTQYLAENHYEERLVIAATLQYLKDEAIDYIISFNGASFDIPFFNSRAESLGFEEGIRMYDFDLYSFLRKHSNLPGRIESLSQKSVERFFAMAGARRDTISGAESVKLYNEYAVNGNPINEKLILTHNREDVAQLHTLMLKTVSDRLPDILRCNSFDEAMACFGYPIRIADSRPEFTIRTTLDCKRARLCINGDQLCEPINLEIYPDDSTSYRASFASRTRSLSVELPLEAYGDGFYINIKALGLDTELREHDAYVNGFFILRNDGLSDWAAINKLVATLVRKLYCETLEHE
ncbi:MAG: ribonuclease H-like domain-containing protein [Firmicutes bacterium]|nr:ribonuclease H-like domain-containing protein [Bacillota bacterium]